MTGSDLEMWTWGMVSRGARAINYYAFYPMNAGYESGGYGMISLDGTLTERSRRAGQIASRYRERITEVLDRLWTTQTKNIEKAAAVMAECIGRGGLVHMFGSGHSVLPVQDMFPRYGAFPGFRPLMDMRLMWTNVIGSGGAKGLLWLERREGYAADVLFENEPIRQGDVMLAFSHGGLNAAAIEVLLESKKRGLTTVAVTSMDNYRKREARHSSGKKLPDGTTSSIIVCPLKTRWCK